MIELFLMNIQNGKVQTGVHSVIYTPIEGHSKKPDIVRDKIIDLCGNIPRIELFARDKIKGWDAWGNEVPDEKQYVLPQSNEQEVEK